MLARNAIIMVGLGVLSLAGCHSPVQQDVDGLICNRAGQPMDVSDFLIPPPKAPVVPPTPKDPFLRRMEVPANTPGSGAPQIKLPVNFKDFTEKEKQVAMDKYFKSQMEVGPDPPAVPGPDGRPFSLADLQKLAREHSPLLRQAAANIDNFVGAQVQAAVYNNPVLSYATTPVSFTSGNIVGPGISETIVTMGKRKLAEGAAKMDVENAKLAYRRAETDLMASVRSNYFQVLVNEEGMKANRALMDLTDQIYNVMLLQLKQGKVAAYEPAQIGVFAGQARIAYIQSRNSYLESWKMLATSIGLTMMPVTQLSGSISSELPRFNFEKSLAHVLENHTDALTARNGIDKARMLLRLAEVTAVPDVTVGAMLYNDNSAPGPPRFVPSLTASIPVPFFDRNQGNIKSAQASLLFAVEQPHATQNALTASFADAYRRLEENRTILDLYRKQLLPQQVQAFRATVLRHWGIGEYEMLVAGGATAYFGDLISSEQNLVSLIASYLATLSSYWQAVSDTASLLQIDDAYLMPTTVEKMPGYDLLDLLKLPCNHPCSSLQQAGHSHSAGGSVPNADCNLQAALPIPVPVPITSSSAGQQGMSEHQRTATGDSVVDPVPLSPLPEVPHPVVLPPLGFDVLEDDGEVLKGAVR